MAPAGIHRTLGRARKPPPALGLNLSKHVDFLAHLCRSRRASARPRGCLPLARARRLSPASSPIRRPLGRRDLLVRSRPDDDQAPVPVRPAPFACRAACAARASVRAGRAGRTSGSPARRALVRRSSGAVADSPAASGRARDGPAHPRGRVTCPVALGLPARLRGRPAPSRCPCLASDPPLFVGSLRALLPVGPADPSCAAGPGGPLSRRDPRPPGRAPPSRLPL